MRLGLGFGVGSVEIGVGSFGVWAGSLVGFGFLFTMVVDSLVGVVGLLTIVVD